jgi:tetratricopeptide (TPR) repeat protein
LILNKTTWNQSSVTVIDIKPASRRILLIATLLVLAAVHWYIGKWGLGNMVSTRAVEPQIADVALDMAPGDPQTHYAAAVLYDRTFIAADQERSLHEYEQAAALSPNNYLLWLEYGKALERNGDPTRAEAALKRALALAPNYAAVHWALGNLLVRNGETDAGFDEIRKAVQGDPQYASSAAAFAYQFFDGDLNQTRQVAGTSGRANAALALLLARQKRFDEAISVWRSVGQPMDDTILTSGKSLESELTSAKQFGLALSVGNTLDDSPAFDREKVHDGGFEDAIKLEGASPFEWQVGPGTQPQVLQSTSQPHGGSRSLVLRFNSNDGSGLRAISQTVVVRPNMRYSISGFYHSDLNADGKLVWQVIDAANGAVVAEVPLGTPANWTVFSVNFQAPAGTDAVIQRLSVSGCNSALCPINGSVWLDDVDLKAI